jgi:hypothetical protein
MMEKINPPRHGEGNHEVVEGRGARPHPCAWRACPSTILRMVPLPVPGRIVRV